MPLQPGMILENRYRVESLLGQGGMGAVYKAFDQRLRMAVALKENSLVTLDARAQFEREALTLARLHHSNLPTVTDHFITADGAVPGDDLHRGHQPGRSCWPAAVKRQPRC
ncbi:hypothetical protein [Candidatus Amarolinea dominans]|uniref:hypothetical protein n=1 Tax=Candidatus Amarolinea dominans TaxID=3140696 RepID=UPI001D6C8A98|nr:hypothetical protein [Anaerolineae bacterium]